MIAIIDYGMGNLASIAKALEYVGGEVVITNDKSKIAKANKIVLPGVGAFADGIKKLKELELDKVLEEEILGDKKPFLGICLGMQLLAQKSFEFGEHEGLGFVEAEVKLLSNKDVRVPHVGWDNIELKKESKIFEKVKNGSDFYFVHSYYFEPKDKDIVSSICDYGQKFVASIEKDNIFATQFHPEKSQKDGLQILENFVDYPV